MMKELKLLFVVLSVVVLLNSCAKELEEYNRPALFWYSKIIESVSGGNIDKADDYY